MPSIFRSTTAAIAACALSGCAALNSTAWKFSGPDGTSETKIVTVDAKQRHLILSRDPGGKLKYCAEAAPDVFSALSSSLTGAFDFSGAQKKGEAAAAIAESAATIERTQTVNLLRESFYRTCERWLSGAIEKNEFLVLAARDHRSMVAVLAIESMTGAVKPSPTVISAPAVQAAANQSEELLKLLVNADKERSDTKAGYAKAKKDYDKASAQTVTIDSKTVPACSDNIVPASDEDKKKVQECELTRTAKDEAKKKFEAADQRDKSIRSQLSVIAGGLAAATSANTTKPNETNNETSSLTGTDLWFVAKAVENIALTAGVDEALMFCVSYLRDPSLVGTTRETCNGVVLAAATQDAKTKERVGMADSSTAEAILNSVNDFQLKATQLKLFEIRAAISLRIAQTEKGRLASEIRKFEAAVSARSGLANRCSSLKPTECAKLVLDGHYDGFGLTSDTDEVQKALQAWAIPE